jgi:hypothetical protein
MASTENLPTYEDPGVLRLRAEIAAVEDEVLTLEEEKSYLDCQLLAYNERFRREVGTLMEHLLDLRRLRREREFVAGSATTAERAEAEDDYRKLHDECGQPDQIQTLSAEEQIELKKLFRSGSKLCHPDVVAVELKTEASLRFQELKDAQLRNDLTRMRALVAALEQGGFRAHGGTNVNEVSVLRAVLQRLQRKCQSLAHEIAALRQTTALQAIEGIEDWTAYFADLRQRLEKQIAEEIRHAGA